MNRTRSILLAGVAVLALAPSAMAQTTVPAPAGGTRPAQTPASVPTPAPAPAPATPQAAQDAPAAEPAEAEPSAVGDVVVTGSTTEVRTSIDSVSYSLANDLQATTGSLADALRNVPSVDVDPQGNVSLRGDSGVTILVDGRPSGILTGEGRAQALLQLPADRYARIEVMTNPSAAYSPEGSGGVINLITKPTAPRAGSQTTGSIRANVGDNGRWNLGGSGSWQKDRLTLSGDLSYRADPSQFELNRLREQLDPVTGAVVSTTRNDTTQESDQTGTVARFSAEYRLTDRTQLTGEVRSIAFQGDGDVDSLFETRNAAGAVTSAYRRAGGSDFDYANWGATARLLHRFDDAGHEWSNELRYDSNSIESGGLTLTDFLVPAGTGLAERTDQDQDQVTLGFTSAYVRPTADGGKLRLGYELTDVRPDQDVTFRQGPSEGTLSVVPGFSNRFEARQTVHALYGTWERPLTEKLSAQAGLRLEQADIEIDDLTGGASASQDYFRAYPTAHLQYQLSETETLRASYSRRIQRPQPAQLNPFVSYGDPLNRRSGNPDLEPQETDAFEAMWQKRQGTTFYQVTAYLRDTDKAFTEVVTDLGGGVFLTRPENLGARRDLGLETTANGALHPTLRYSAGVNVFRQEIDAAGLPGGQDREGTFATGRLSLNWTPTAKDFVQVSGFWQGESLLAQGTREAGGMLNIGYRRKLTDSLSFNFTGRDVLNSFNNTSVYETPLFRERAEQNIRLRAFYIGLSWTLGTGPRRPPEQFDFSTGPGGG
ncbi:TonB-dependent receptor domain-containing protein [Brevundimonas subvibrioides]|uniref:TonB-dependent receptor plug n=1 Tax=Brevundimonas subvibrioides (strain ATCC 15264 / DSM 4735 / LMG 14903 / NBRC 16000 / CB 81) TaxID=633149 RepID=D9QJ68_BRESC|nr:TonB-dependent receptor [Brevundimonas subvibrioides]ADK99592.1 TonB-dependent receptor plug [Brevundimonas subvibrioides ATCC 15264]